MPKLQQAAALPLAIEEVTEVTPDESLLHGYFFVFQIVLVGQYALGAYLFQLRVGLGEVEYVPV